jgi:hypothetical protein
MEGTKKQFVSEGQWGEDENWRDIHTVKPGMLHKHRDGFTSVFINQQQNTTQSKLRHFRKHCDFMKREQRNKD